MKECENLGIAGIVAEFNPFHNGHKFILDEAKRENDMVITVISGNFVQRGDVAIISKFDRARQALLCGADLVCELPVEWSMSTAQNFAFGAISQLNALGVDTIYFGSESGDLEGLVTASNILNSKDFKEQIKASLNTNKTFASIRQEILSKSNPSLSPLLDNPNDSLAIEYIAAANLINKNIKFCAIKRQGVSHDSKITENDFCSAGKIRAAISNDNLASLIDFMPLKAYEILSQSNYASITNLEVAILSKLRSMTLSDFRQLPDISEGIENSIYKESRTAVSLNELYDRIKSKRYTHARIRRIILSAFLELDSSHFKKEPPYVRVLGFKDNAINKSSNNNRKPIITRVAEISKLGDFSKSVFETECRATDLYSLSLKTPKPSGAEYTTPLIKL